MSSLCHGFRHYIDFSGRDNRALFWGFIISTHVIFCLLLIPVFICFPLACFSLIRFLLECVGSAAGAGAASPSLTTPFAGLSSMYPNLIACGASVLVAYLWLLAIVVPTISATVRRLRDAGQSPWWVLPPCLVLAPSAPLLGSIGWLALPLCCVTFVLCCLPSKPVTADKGSLPPLP